MKKYYGLYTVVCIAYTLVAAAADTPQNPFEQLNKRAEKQYEASSDQATSTKREKVIQKDSINEPVPCTTKPSLTLNDALHIKNLLYTVQKPKMWSFERLSCKRLLRKNPQWQRIKDEMSQPDKDKLLRIIADELLSASISEDNKTKKAFRVACAVCAGANPNSRTNALFIHPDRTIHHPTLLQLSCTDDNQSLFNFLVRHGADLDLVCHDDSYPHTGRECAKFSQWPIPKQSNSSQGK